MAEPKMTNPEPPTASFQSKLRTNFNPKKIFTGKFFREAGSAAIGGGLHALFEQPLATPIEAAITQTQINAKGFFYNFRDLWKQGGLYRSLPTALVGAVPKAVIHYSLLNIWINSLAPDGDMKNCSPSESALIGFLTGSAEVAFTSPLNFVKFRMQRPEWGYKGMGDAIRTIARDEGIGAFWKGTGATFLLFMGFTLSMYQRIEAAIPEKTPFRHLMAGTIGGIGGSLAAYPFEMLRAARQHNIPFFQDIVSKGPRRILAGWPPGALRLTVTAGIMGVLIPRLKGWSKNLKKEELQKLKLPWKKAEEEDEVAEQ